MSVVSYTPCAENIHTWSTEYTIDREATCTQNGSKSIHCTNCGEIDEKTITAIEMTEHEYGEWKVTDVATCVGVGSQKRLCKNCGYSEVQEIPATGHIWSTEYTIDKEATCTQEGSQSIHCTKCDEKTEVKSRPATGHIHTEIQRKISATCTAKGYTGDTYCKDCNKVIKKGTSVSKIAHTYDSGKITKEATCLATGEKTYTCKKCKYQAKEPIQKLKAVVTLKKTSTTIAVGKTVTETWVKSMTKGDYVKSFTSSNSKVATISGKKTGVCTVKGIKAGTTTMTLKFASGLTKKVTVKVKDIVCTKISGVKSSVSVKVNKTYKLTPTITPSNCTQKITYSSSNAKIAKVSSSGKITGVKKGTCRVYVQCGSKKITVKVTVL
jgi:hypothetical protein